MTSDPLYALSLAVVVATLYVVILRLVDLNEKEPLWALGVALFMGSVGGAIAFAVVAPEFRLLSTFGAAFTAELTKLIAMLLTFGMFAGISRWRGWSEVNGVSDGVVYGAAVGLGFASGAAFARELSVSTAAVGLSEENSSFTLLWTTLLFGLEEGLFGALIGAGFGLAIPSRLSARWVIFPLLGFGTALFLHAGYIEFSDGGALSGDAGFIRKWISLAIPLLLIAALMVYSLTRERRGIAEELADEAASGSVTADELALLLRPAARRRQYLSRIARGDLDGWIDLRALHNRQVQLALVESRLRRETDERQRSYLSTEVENLRRSIASLRGSEASGPRRAVGAES